MNPRIKGLYEFGSFQLNSEEHILLHDGQIVHLTPKAFDILLLLIENKGHVVAKDELLDEVWPDTIVEEANVAKSVSLLRKVLSEDGFDGQFIETIPTRGYRFIAPVREFKSEKPVQAEKPGESIPPKSSKITIGMVATLLLVAVMSIGAWYYLSYLINTSAPPLQAHRVSLLTEDGKSSFGTVSPDGKLVAFVNTKVDGKSNLVVRRIATGSSIEIVPPTDRTFIIQPTFSPDGEFIYYAVREEITRTLYRVPVLGGQSKKLIMHVISNVAVSPDGIQLAFNRTDPTDKGFKIVVADNDGENLSVILSKKDIGYDQFKHVSWSNDGQRLLITGVENAGESGKKFSGVWVDKNDKTVTEATELKPLIEQKWFDIRGFKLLKDGSGIMFTGKKRLSDQLQIFHLSIADGKITPVTSDTSEYVSVSISDDGKTLLANKLDRTGDLISYTLDSKEIKQLINKNKAFTLESGFSQMPDGKILVSKKTGQGTEIFSIDEDGSNEIQLTSNNRINSTPLATPDGKYIVFLSREERSDGSIWFGELWRIEADGSNPIQLTNDPQNQVDIFDISKDGKTIFFDRHSRSERFKSHLVKISINGGEVTPIIPESSTMDYFPKISPDGQSLAFVSESIDSKSSQYSRAINIHSLNEEHVGELKNKFDLEELGFWFDWTPDGNALTFIDRGKRPANLWNLDVATGKKTALTSFEYESDSLGVLRWALDGKRILIVRRFFSQDVVLINGAGTSAD